MSRTWYAILTIYMGLFFITGYINFISDNHFSTTPEVIEKITKDYDEPEKMKFVEELVQEDAENYQEQNNIASQSFNVVLGSIVSFLAATMTQQNNDK
jgi:uncharacterized membrane protein